MTKFVKIILAMLLAAPGIVSFSATVATVNCECGTAAGETAETSCGDPDTMNKCKETQCLVNGGSAQIGDCTHNGTGDYCGCQMISPFPDSLESWSTPTEITELGCAACPAGWTCIPFHKVRAGDPTTNVQKVKQCRVLPAQIIDTELKASRHL